MANTEALLALQTEYPTAFADPEAMPLNGNPTDFAGDPNGTVLGEEIASSLEIMHPDQARDFAEGHLQAQAEQDEECEEMSAHKRCSLSLLQLKDDPQLMTLAVDFLDQLSLVKSIKQRLEIEPIRRSFQKLADAGNLDPMHQEDLKFLNEVGLTHYERALMQSLFNIYGTKEWGFDKRMVFAFTERETALMASHKTIERVLDKFKRLGLTEVVLQGSGRRPTRYRFPTQKQRIKKRQEMLPTLPETHARQGSVDCPGGLCPLD
jgi:hypothetical protein